MRKAEQPMYEKLLESPRIQEDLEFIAEKLGLTQRQTRLLVARAIRKTRSEDCHPLKPHNEQQHASSVRSHIQGIVNQLDEPRRQKDMAQRSSKTKSRSSLAHTPIPLASYPIKC